MYICFAEYRIMPEHKEHYLKKINDWRDELGHRVNIYEGTDQPGLFVEVWQAESEEMAEQIKKERLDGRSLWGEITPWIAGGAAKLHVWTFRPVAGDWKQS
ncbi:hypothetical protein ACFQZE_22210 [Paenibacillus sp. GCM10027627]|uniref:hypothetical protein n=1 Tax=unclassified Paenibacillus TaxID=185978 RepID=UPI00364503BC